MKNNITPLDYPGSHQTGRLENITVQQIEEIIGFPANCIDDTSKVEYSWGFSIEGKEFGVWDYKGSHAFNSFSTYGDHLILANLFGNSYKNR